MRIWASEAVTEGHPDKLCDIISDSLVDAYLTEDSDSRVAVETSAKDGLITLNGEISAPERLDNVAIVRDAIASVGYLSAESGLDARACGVIDNIRPRRFDSDSAAGYRGDLTKFDSLEDAYNNIGDDQGLMIGYACTDTESLMPLPVFAANRLAERLAYAQKQGIVPELQPDGKTMVAVEYSENNLTHPVRVTDILVSTQYREGTPIQVVRDRVLEQVIAPVMAKFDVDPSDANIIVNNTPWTFGGPAADAGVTGRKIIVDTYGGVCGHGGGAFSGKDPRKIDRSGAYMARYVAKNVVAAKLAERCQIMIAYLHEQASPAVIDVDCFSTEKIDINRIRAAVRAVFDFRQLAIIDKLNLRRPIYRKTAVYGHFGRTDPDFTWEKTDKVSELLAYI